MALGLVRLFVQHRSENYLQRVEQAFISTLNEIAGQAKQPQMTRRVPFDPRLGRFSLAGANQVHNASAGGCNHTLHARHVLRVLLEKLSHGYLERFRYSAKGLGAWLEVAIFNAR